MEGDGGARERARRESGVKDRDDRDDVKVFATSNIFWKDCAPGVARVMFA